MILLTFVLCFLAVISAPDFLISVSHHYYKGLRIFGWHKTIDIG